MPAFQFRLAPVLRLRERQRETQRLAFAAIEEQRLRIVTEIHQLEERVAAYARQLMREDGQDLQVIDLQLYGEFIHHLEQALQSKRALLRTVEEQREAQRLTLLEADKEVKSLEQLRARMEERHCHEEAASAQQQADEVGQRKYLTNQQVLAEKGEPTADATASRRTKEPFGR